LARGTAAIETQSQSTDASHQAKLQRLEAEVAALRHQLRESQKLATMGTMTAMIAHEFNNILTPIINYAQLAQSNPKLTGKAIDRAADGGQRAMEICRALLNMSGPGENHPVQCNLWQMAEETLAAMARPMEKDGIDLVVDIPQDLTLVTRPVEIKQVVLNLLINARQAVLDGHGPQRKVEITARKEDGWVILQIIDTGVGFDESQAEQIFQPFYTTRSEDGSGHGLGLAFCRQIAESNGGSISAEGRPGQGAAFTVQIPAD